MFGYNISLLIPLLMHRKISLFKLCPFSILDLTTTCERGKADKSVIVRKCSDENTTKRVKRERDRMLRTLIEENSVPTTDGAFRCILCTNSDQPLTGRRSSILQNKTTRRRHFIDIHWADAPSYICPEDNCQITNTSRSAFAAHMRRFHAEWKGVPLDTFIKR